MLEDVIPNHKSYLSSVVAERLTVIVKAAGTQDRRAAYARHVRETEDWLDLYRETVGETHPLQGMWRDLKASFLGSQGPQAVREEAA
jgi:hypothetical protein